jgi:YVTN family beta-propeller protein
MCSTVCQQVHPTLAAGDSHSLSSTTPSRASSSPVVASGRSGTWRAGQPVPVGQASNALAVTPDGRTVLAVDGDSDTVTPLAATGRGGGRSASVLTAGPPVPVGYSPIAVAITASGTTAFIVNTISGTLTPVSVTNGTVEAARAGQPISVGLYSYPTAIELAPTGALAVLIDSYGDQVTLVNTRTHHAVRRINVGSYPVAVAITP